MIRDTLSFLTILVTHAQMLNVKNAILTTTNVSLVNKASAWTRQEFANLANQQFLVSNVLIVTTIIKSVSNAVKAVRYVSSSPWNRSGDAIAPWKAKPKQAAPKSLRMSSENGAETCSLRSSQIARTSSA